MEPKKTEKLVSALYLLTSFFDEKEPMKWRLRELGGILLSQKESGNIVLEIRSLLQVAKNAGLISDTNFEIIHREFGRIAPVESVAHLLESSSEEESRLVPLPNGVPALAPHKRETASRPEAYEGSAPTSKYLETPEPVRHFIKDKTKEPRQSGTVALKKNGRQSTILALLKKKKEIMIKDVSPLIPGVSEKTIQRELLAMVASGILNKIGEKRWSRYTLAE